MSTVKFTDKAIARFNAKWEPEPMSGCWLWVACAGEDGYGRFAFAGRTWRAYRFSYELHKGEVSAGLELDHLCRNRGCVNPDHLEAVTHRENILRGESPSAIHARKTQCTHGHRFTSENTITRVDNSRRCLKCSQVSGVDRYTKLKATGLCVTCYTKKRVTKSQCESCSRIWNERGNTRRIRLQAAELCSICGKRRRVTKNHCEPCRKRHKAYQKAYRERQKGRVMT